MELVITKKSDNSCSWLNNLKRIITGFVGQAYGLRTVRERLNCQTQSTQKMRIVFSTNTVGGNGINWNLEEFLSFTMWKMWSWSWFFIVLWGSPCSLWVRISVMGQEIFTHQSRIGGCNLWGLSGAQTSTNPPYKKVLLGSLYLIYYKLQGSTKVSPFWLTGSNKTSVSLVIIHFFKKKAPNAFHQ